MTHITLKADNGQIIRNAPDDVMWQSKDLKLSKFQSDCTEQIIDHTASLTISIPGSKCLF